MEKQCPHCGTSFSETGDDQACLHCGGSLSEKGPDEPVENEEYYCSWDDRQKIGFFKALFDTWMQSMFNPVKFFSKMPPESGMGGPLLYGFIMSEISLLVAMMWQGMSLFVPSFVERSGMEYLGAPMAGMTFVFFLSPILVLVGLFLSSAILHLCLLIVGGARQSFETTFRVVCF